MTTTEAAENGAAATDASAEIPELPTVARPGEVGSSATGGQCEVTFRRMEVSCTYKSKEKRRVHRCLGCGRVLWLMLFNFCGRCEDEKTAKEEAAKLAKAAAEKEAAEAEQRAREEAEAKAAEAKADKVKPEPGAEASAEADAVSGATGKRKRGEDDATSSDAAPNAKAAKCADSASPGAAELAAGDLPTALPVDGPDPTASAPAAPPAPALGSGFGAFGGPNPLWVPLPPVPPLPPLQPAWAEGGPPTNPAKDAKKDAEPASKAKRIIDPSKMPADDSWDYTVPGLPVNPKPNVDRGRPDASRPVPRLDNPRKLHRVPGAGGPDLRSLTPAEQSQALQARRKREMDDILAMDTASNDPDKTQTPKRWYIVSEKWLSKWRDFVFTQSRGPNKPPLPPLEVNNDPLLVTKSAKVEAGSPLEPKAGLKQVRHYRGVNGDVWRYFMRIYGGGPALVREELNIYARALEDAPSEIPTAPDAKGPTVPGPAGGIPDGAAADGDGAAADGDGAAAPAGEPSS
jgi:hypothetical protein